MERKIKIFKIIHGSFQTSFRNFHVDGEPNGSKKSVDEELKVLSITTLEA
jgi:hypothetical protein